MSFLVGPWDTFLVYPLMGVSLVAYSFVRDFGLAIILITVAIRLIVYPLYVTQIRSQRAMQELAPALSELKKKYGNDRQRISQEQMKLYGERGVNPAAGCLPLVLQMPILFALYSALTQLGCGLGKGGSNCPGLSYDEAKQVLGFLSSFITNPVPVNGTLDTTANWLPWITSGLQQPDPWVLPIIAGAAQLVASVMAMPAKPAPTSDPNQRMFQSMAYTFPLLTVVLGRQFPAGLTLYWIATTIFQIVQQYFVVGWGQLPKYLPFLRGVPTPADREMARREAAAVAEARQDMRERDAEAGAAPAAAASPAGAREGRRRGRRRGKR